MHAHITLWQMELIDETIHLAKQISLKTAPKT